VSQWTGRYDLVVEASPNAMLIVDQSGLIVFVNAAAEKLFGYGRELLLGRAIEMLVPQRFRARHPANRAGFFANPQTRAMGEGRDLFALRADGTEVPVEIGLNPIVTQEGSFVISSIIDLSERKRADERFRLAVEAAPNAMIMTNEGGTIVLVNRQAEILFGYSREEMIGRPVEMLVPERMRHAHPGLRCGFFTAPRARMMGAGRDLYCVRKDGIEVPVEIGLKPLRTAEGTFVLSAVIDISVRKTAEAELAQNVVDLHRSNEELQQFAHIASHDLQEPLRMVASYTELLSQRYKGKLDADADEFIAFAVDGATRMQRLIQDLQTFSRVGSRGADLVPTSSEKALLQALTNLRGPIEDQRALVTHDPLPGVLADETQLVQLLQNLVGNAIKYHAPGVPAVHVAAAKKDGDAWTFSVRDNGLGIESQYFERIFGMFQRLHKREEFAGTGIGLAICKKIVERHGGTISVESQPGQGSTFRFDLKGSEPTP